MVQIIGDDLAEGCGDLIETLSQNMLEMTEEKQEHYSEYKTLMLPLHQTDLAHSAFLGI
jgi:hypothetical protein